jgi:ketosteroid isomerase-like protein
MCANRYGIRSGFFWAIIAAMNATEQETQARAFFDEFVQAFASFDGRAIAGRYLSPYLAFHAPGSSQVFMSPDETASYFQRIVDGYHARGCRSCRYADLQVVALGRDCALATVTWELLAQDLSVLESWRESYNLCLVEGCYKVFASTDHTA